MKDKKVLLSREDLENVTAGEAEEEQHDITFIPAPKPGYKYCEYMSTCPNFDWRVCQFPIFSTGSDTLSCQAN